MYLTFYVLSTWISLDKETWTKKWNVGLPFCKLLHLHNHVFYFILSIGVNSRTIFMTLAFYFFTALLMFMIFNC